MGVDTNIACKTCKKVFYLGYGSYSSEQNRVDKFPMEEHNGHDITKTFSTDYLRLRADGHYWQDIAGIVGDYEDQIFIENYIDYERVDL